MENRDRDTMIGTAGREIGLGGGDLFPLLGLVGVAGGGGGREER